MTQGPDPSLRRPYDLRSPSRWSRAVFVAEAGTRETPGTGPSPGGDQGGTYPCRYIEANLQQKPGKNINRCSADGWQWHKPTVCAVSAIVKK